MPLFNLFDGDARQREEELSQNQDLDIYTGMKVEVISDDDRMFLTAEVVGLRGDRAQLKPCMDGSLLAAGEAVPVTIRGVSSKENRAVVMQARLRVSGSGSWQAEHLALLEKGDNRASVRVPVGFDAFLRYKDGQEPVDVLNMSTGGACIFTRARHNVGEKLTMLLTLPIQSGELTLPVQILRINERRNGCFEYGCKFLNIDEELENRLARAVFELHGQNK